MPVRPRFDPKRPLIAARAFHFLGRTYAAGDPFPNPDDEAAVNDRLRARQYEARAVSFAPDSEPDPVQMREGPKNGRWMISAPWLDEDEEVRGKKNAEDRVAELRAEGPPLGWIEGGSVIEVEGNEDDGFTVMAPWFIRPAVHETREAAETAQRALHEAGEPAYHNGVELTEGDNAYWTVKADWIDDAETVHGEEAARARAAELRDQGPPDEPEQDPAEGGDADQADGTQDGPAEGDPPAEGDDGAQEGTDANSDNAETDKDADEGENADQAPAEPEVDADALTTATHTGGGYYEIAAPWLKEAERVRGKDAAEARRVEIAEAGPPEGWAPADS